MNLCKHVLGCGGRDVSNKAVKVYREKKSRPKLHYESVPNLESWRVVFLVFIGLVQLILGKDDHLAVEIKTMIPGRHNDINTAEASKL